MRICVMGGIVRAASDEERGSKDVGKETSERNDERRSGGADENKTRSLSSHLPDTPGD
jgi:hypothetical protein